MHEKDIFIQYADHYSIQVQDQMQNKFNAKNLAATETKKWLVDNHGFSKEQAHKALTKAIIKYKHELI